MTKQETLARLCRLAATVREYPPLIERAGQSLAADCFCGQSESSDAIRRGEVADLERMTGLDLQANTYCFDEAVIVFIEEAVEVAMRSKGIGTTFNFGPLTLCRD